MSKNKTYGSTIPQDALIFEVNGVKYRRGETKKVGKVYYCDVLDLSTGKWSKLFTFNKIEKYLLY